MLFFRDILWRIGLIILVPGQVARSNWQRLAALCQISSLTGCQFFIGRCSIHPPRFRCLHDVDLFHAMGEMSGKELSKRAIYDRPFLFSVASYSPQSPTLYPQHPTFTVAPVMSRQSSERYSGDSYYPSGYASSNSHNNYPQPRYIPYRSCWTRWCSR